MIERFVVDASIATKWMFEEEDSDLALGLAGGPHVAPELLLLECASAIWSRIRKNLLPADEAPPIFQILQDVPLFYVPNRQVLGDALVLAVDLDHPIYDCIYLALAMRYDLRVVTADQRFVRAVRTRSRLAARIATLGEAVAN